MYIQSNRNYAKVQMLFYFFLSLLLGADLEARSKWAIGIYMQAEGSLSKPAAAALDSLVSSLSGKNASGLQIFVEAHFADSATRYQVDTSGLHELTKKCLLDPYSSLQEFCSWFFEITDAEHTMLILSGHGSGILQPIYNARLNRWLYEPDEGDSYYAEYRMRKNELFSGLIFECCNHKALFLGTATGQQAAEQSGTEQSMTEGALTVGSTIEGSMTKRSTAEQPAAEQSRTEQSRTERSITKQALTVGPTIERSAASTSEWSATERSVVELLVPGAAKSPVSSSQLSEILTNALQGRMIDIIGFDACHMGMIEIAHDLRLCARLMIGSQDCEENDGWDYAELINAAERNSSPFLVARDIVYSYEKSQRGKQHSIFSLSAYDLSLVDEFTQSLREVVRHLHGCLRFYKNEFHDLLCLVRQKNQRFCFIPMYADLYAFFNALYEEVSVLETSDELELLKISLLSAIELHQRMIIASTAGASCPSARGCSIYFPFNHCDTSYTKNLCAQLSGWNSFLETFIAV